MNFSNVLAPLALSALAAGGAVLSTSSSPFSGRNADPGSGLVPLYSVDTTDTAKKTEDTVTAPMLGTTLRYGMDTTVSPCLDFYQYANGDWRARTRFGKPKPGRLQRVDFFLETGQRSEKRLEAIIDSAYSVRATTKDPALKALSMFYESCMVADTLESNKKPGFQPKPKTPPKDSTRAEQCRKRTLNYMGGVVGQVFAQDLFATHAVDRMKQLLEALRTAIADRLKVHPLMTPSERSLALERLQKLYLRVGIPDKSKMTDYGPLVAMLTNNYAANTKAISNFSNKRALSSIGGDQREQWKMALTMPNAAYMPHDHSIEIPAVMFMPPFFDPTGDDALNFGGIGMVIGHEIYHSLTSQLKSVENPEMEKQIELLKELNSSLGSLDGWNTNGKRTYTEDVADLGGVLVAYSAWQATVKASGKNPAPLIDGLTPDQRFFYAIGRIWRSKWGSTSGSILSQDVHAAPFARVNAMVMQSPAFAKAFGCKVGDPMVPTPDRLATKIW